MMLWLYVVQCNECESGPLFVVSRLLYLTLLLELLVILFLLFILGMERILLSI